MAGNTNSELIEKYKDLYLRSKEVLNEELNRFNRIDEKASRYIAVLTFLAGIYVYFFKKIFTDFCHPSSFIEWEILASGIAAFVFIFFAWLSVFRVLQQHEILQTSFNSDVIKFYDNNRLIDIYYATAKENNSSIQTNREIIDKKFKKLDFAYQLIGIVMVLFLNLAIFYGQYIFFGK